MKMVLAKGIVVASVAAVLGGLGSRPGLAHNDWGLPLVGGLVGGYAPAAAPRCPCRPGSTAASER